MDLGLFEAEEGLSRFCACHSVNVRPQPARPGGVGPSGPLQGSGFGGRAKCRWPDAHDGRLRAVHRVSQADTRACQDAAGGVVGEWGGGQEPARHAPAREAWKFSRMGAVLLGRVRASGARPSPWASRPVSGTINIAPLGANGVHQVTRAPLARDKGVSEESVRAGHSEFTPGTGNLSPSAGAGGPEFRTEHRNVLRFRRTSGECSSLGGLVSSWSLATWSVTLFSRVSRARIGAGPWATWGSRLQILRYPTARSGR